MFGLAVTTIKQWRTVLWVGFVAVLAVGCIVETPGIENTQVETDQELVVEPTAAAVVPQFEPTVPPAPPTPAALPTPTPAPTSTPEPIAPPVEVTPLPTAGPNTDFVPTDVEAGPIAIPVGGTSFVLDAPRPVLQLGGHSLIYLDSDLLAEVDIFTPVADREGNVFNSYDQLVRYIQLDDAFAGLEELDVVTIAGSPTRVFDGTTLAKPEAPQRAFITDPTRLDDELLGWFPPVRVRMWVIDAPSGPLVLSAESLEDPGQFEDALDLATEILSSINFG